jgi:hypothetical protein
MLVDVVLNDYEYMRDGTLTGEWGESDKITEIVDIDGYVDIFDCIGSEFRLSVFPIVNESENEDEYKKEFGYQLHRKYLASYYTPNRKYEDVVFY